MRIQPAMDSLLEKVSKYGMCYSARDPLLVSYNQNRRERSLMSWLSKIV